MEIGRVSSNSALERRASMEPMEMGRVSSNSGVERRASMERARSSSTPNMAMAPNMAIEGKQYSSFKNFQDLIKQHEASRDTMQAKQRLAPALTRPDKRLPVPKRWRPRDDIPDDGLSSIRTSSKGGDALGDMIRKQVWPDRPEEDLEPRDPVMGFKQLKGPAPLPALERLWDNNGAVESTEARRNGVTLKNKDDPKTIKSALANGGARPVSRSGERKVVVVQSQALTLRPQPGTTAGGPSPPARRRSAY